MSLDPNNCKFSPPSVNPSIRISYGPNIGPTLNASPWRIRVKRPICPARHLPEILFARTVFGGGKLRLVKRLLICVAMRIHAWDAMLIERRNEPELRIVA